MTEEAKKLGNEPVAAYDFNYKDSSGLTKREYFSVLAMRAAFEVHTNLEPINVAECAIEYADALLEVLSKTE